MSDEEENQDTSISGESEVEEAVEAPAETMAAVPLMIPFPGKLDLDGNISTNWKKRIPIALKPKLKTELQRLETLGVIKSVDTPADWVSSLVIVKKPSGKIRLCIEPKPLNKALKRCHYPLPIIEDLLPELNKAKVYTKCDVKNGFWHVTLAEESSYLSTFETPFGRFRWIKIPFGISPAPEYLQQFLKREIEGLPGIKTVADNILIYGEGDTIEAASQDHDSKLKALLDRCRERNVKINKDKFMLRVTEMPYIGHLLTADGVKPDPEKIATIVNMEKPTNVKGNLSEICEQIRQLTHKDNAWNWTHEHDEYFEMLKQAVTKAPVLKYFDSKSETTLQCDASEKGLGATLMQKSQPTEYASRALTKTEQNYAQIEKELLAVVLGMEKFH
ncbi:unnamed protein product [Mytilus coruscus]|uniref:Reverse transcriptase domain-containing protein n=1 Tax=Mytilus coruscus TaxID=42192 RepID=A0A6J8ERT6_MYTCO|nr:unnamed protein product [Mytilus coruscus]